MPFAFLSEAMESIFLPTNILLLATSITALIYIYRQLTFYRILSDVVVQNGCRPPNKYPHRDRIWGTDLLKIRMKAVQEGAQMNLFMVHFKQFGKTWEENFFGTRVYNTMDVQNIQQVSALSFQDYGKPAQNFFKPFLGDGILSLDGSAWKHSRDLVKPIFSRSEVSDVETLSFHVDRFLDQIPCDGSTVNLQEPLHRLFLDLSTEFLFGESIEAQLPEDPNNSKDFLKAFNGSLMGVGKRRLAGKLHRFIYAFDRSWKRDINKVYAYVDTHIKRVLDRNAKYKEKGLESPGAVRRYVLLDELAKEITDPIKLRYEMINVFTPSRDTTSVLLANCLFHLARNPEIWIQLRGESIAIGDAPLTFELLKSLQLFRYTLLETLRLQGPAGRAQRLALKHTVLPTGGGADGNSPMLVRQGDVVAMNTWGPNHDSDIWGDDVEEFKPQRFIGRKMNWEFTPFLGGPRICPAQQQVLTQSVYLLVRMTRRFARIENKDQVLQYIELVRMTTESRNGVQVGLFAP